MGNIQNIIFGGLFILGSFISSYSVFIAVRFKQNPKNKGKTKEMVFIHNKTSNIR